MHATHRSRVGMLPIIVAIAAALTLSNGHRHEQVSLREAALEQQRMHEVVRVQEHLAGAERVLSNASQALLSQEQQSARSRNVALLQEYREQGRFPRNIDYPHERRPYFVDDRGVPCAMAYLIASSGRSDLVERIRTSNNNAYVRELAAIPELVEWLDSSGLSLAEAARIQPEYYPELDPEYITTEYALASASTSLLSGASIAWNASAANLSVPPRWRGALGAAVGALSIGLGATEFDSDGGAQTLGIWNAAVGAVAVAAGAYNLLRPGQHPATHSGIERPPVARGTALTLTPVLGSVPGVQFVLAF